MRRSANQALWKNSSRQRSILRITTSATSRVCTLSGRGSTKPMTSWWTNTTIFSQRLRKYLRANCHRKQPSRRWQIRRSFLAPKRRKVGKPCKNINSVLNNCIFPNPSTKKFPSKSRRSLRAINFRSSPKLSRGIPSNRGCLVVCRTLTRFLLTWWLRRCTTKLWTPLTPSLATFNWSN